LPVSSREPGTWAWSLAKALSTELSMPLRLAAASPLEVEVEVEVHAVASTARSPHARKERLSMAHSPVVAGAVIVRAGSVSLKPCERHLRAVCRLARNLQE
jgi:hypothetical protein